MGRTRRALQATLLSILFHTDDFQVYVHPRLHLLSSDVHIHCVLPEILVDHHCFPVDLILVLGSPPSH